MDAKAETLNKALKNDATTIAQAKNLRKELFQSEQDLWQLKRTITKEINEITGTKTFGSRGRNSRQYAMHEGGYGPGMTTNTNNGLCDW